MSIYKRGKNYWYKFNWNGKTIRKSTKQSNDKVARTMEAAHRTALAKGEVGIREKDPAPLLLDFLKKDFLPFVEGHFSDKPHARDYYRYGSSGLLASRLAKRPIDAITSQHAAAYAAAHSAWSPSTINRDLRTLRRDLNLAEEWGKLDKAPKIPLARGERQRDRVLSPEDVNRYLDSCPHADWYDAVLLTVTTGMRPADEVCKLRWEAVELNGKEGKIRIAASKTMAGHRSIPLKPEVYVHFGIPDPVRMLPDRHSEQGFPSKGWVFPRPSQGGHLTESTYKIWHAKALETLAQDPATPEFKAFEPYCLRHTFLTWVAPYLDVFALARLAGHTSIRTTQRYIHPAEKTLEDGLAKLGRFSLKSKGKN